MSDTANLRALADDVGDAVGTRIDVMDALDEVADLLDEVDSWIGTTGGSADAYTLTKSTGPTALFEGLQIRAEIHASNTTSSTLNYNSTGAISIKKFGGLRNVSRGDLNIGQVYTFTYFNSVWNLESANGPIHSRDLSTATITNTAGENPLFSETIEANLLGSGRGFRFTGFGTYTNNTGSSQTFTLRAKFGADTIVTCTRTLSASSSAQLFRFEVLVFNKSATNAQNCFGTLLWGGPQSSNTTGGASSTIDGTLGGLCADSSAVQDTTSDKTFEVTGQHGVQNTNLTVSHLIGFIEPI